MSTLKVNNIQNASGTDAISIGSDGSLSYPNIGRRNLIINGGFQVWQRGTDTGSIQLNQYYGAADRWRTHGSGGTYRVTRQEITTGEENDIGGLQYFHRFAVSTGDNYAGVFYSIEGVRSIPSEETFTISFYAKGTNPGGGHMNLQVQQTFGTSGSSAVTVFTEPFTLTSSWQRFEITKTMSSFSGKTIDDSDSCVELFFQQPADDTSTDAWTFDLTGVQVELGSVATPFEHRSYGEELALCQRYCVAFKPINNGIPIGIGQAYSATNTIISITPPVTMRAEPTATRNGLSIWSASTGSDLAVSSLSVSSGSWLSFVRLDVTVSSGLTVGQAAFLHGTSSPSGSGYLILDSEL